MNNYNALQVHVSVFALNLILILMLTVSASAAETGNITVVITGLRNTNGQVLVSLYNKAEGFPRDRSAVISAQSVSPIESREVTVEFEDFEHGEYAIAILHDENASGDMDYKKFGLPKEGYCFSNNVKPLFRAPKFKKTKFTLDSDNVTQTILMNY